MLQIPPDPPEREIERLSQRLGLSKVLARLLWQRGHRNPEEARRWLKPNFEDLEDPFQFHSYLTNSFFRNNNIVSTLGYCVL